MDECTAIVCHRDAVGVVDVSFVFQGKPADFSYPYCALDLPYFRDKFEEYPEYTVSVRMYDV